MVIRHPLFFYIFSDDIFVSMLPNTTNEIAIRPEFTSPKSFLYFWMTFEYLFGGDAFDYGYNLCWTVLGNRLYSKMYVIFIGPYFNKVYLVTF